MPVFACVVAASALQTAVASADSADVRSSAPSLDPRANLVLESPGTLGPREFAGAVFASYAYQPVRFVDAGGTTYFRPVRHQLGGDLTLGIGLGFRTQAAIDLPFIALQSGSSDSSLGAAGSSQVPVAALGDVRLAAKTAIVANDDAGGPSVALMEEIDLPTGSRTSFAGESSPAVAARLGVGYSLLIASAHVSIGYRLRTDHTTIAPAGRDPYRIGDEAPWALGFRLRPVAFGIDPSGRHTAEVAFHGAIATSPLSPFSSDEGSKRMSPALVAVSDRIELGRYHDAYIIVGGELGLNSAIGVPIFRTVAAFGWAPRAHDMDDDGVPDDLDQCPEIAEDRDGFEDSDGCPDIDDDEDGIVDTEDACPRIAGVASSELKKNGCPAATKPARTSAP